MGYATNSCSPAAVALGVKEINCEQCPFPFCVFADAVAISRGVRKSLAEILECLGRTTEEIANSLGVTTRTIYRYADTSRATQCPQCNMVNSQHVMCKSPIYTVARVDGQYIILLNRHRHAAMYELKSIEQLVDYAFPSSIMRKGSGDHDHWMLTRVELKEAKRFETMCAALSKYILNLVEETKCQQIV